MTGKKITDWLAIYLDDKCMSSSELLSSLPRLILSSSQSIKFFAKEWFFPKTLKYFLGGPIVKASNACACIHGVLVNQGVRKITISVLVPDSNIFELYSFLLLLLLSFFFSSVDYWRNWHIFLLSREFAFPLFISCPSL